MTNHLEASASIDLFELNLDDTYWIEKMHGPRTIRLANFRVALIGSFFSPILLDEIMENMVQFLDNEDHYNLRYTCKYMHQLAHNYKSSLSGSKIITSNQINRHNPVYYYHFNSGLQLDAILYSGSDYSQNS